MRKIHLICNAHLDPSWLWDMDEGAAEALSTFRTAADFCDDYDAFVFNHNEMLLYSWIEEFDPKLFERIKKHAAAGKWHIMGGWFLQPDCNMPSGESIVRQILLGRKYFKEKFGKKPTTAVNFDPFGHSRGLVQIMQLSGYDSYIVCRPEPKYMDLPGPDLIWKGYNNSEIICHRAGMYNSPRGKAREKIEEQISKGSSESELILWGIGDHGGGPSRIDYRGISDLIDDNSNIEIVHSTPEEYFAEIIPRRHLLPVFAADLNPWAVGCYTSQMRVKKKYRRLENEYFFAEKIASHAALSHGMEYPVFLLNEALTDLAKAQFHDSLPGTSVRTVEESIIRMIDHGLEITARIRMKAFYELSKDQRRSEDDMIPILIYNPHPYRVDDIFVCELCLLDIVREDKAATVEVFSNGISLPAQLEKEESNLNIHWRKRIAFRAGLEPYSMNRFDCRISFGPEATGSVSEPESGVIDFLTDDLHVVIDRETGLIDCLESKGYDYLKKGAFKGLVMIDDDDSWGSEVRSFREVTGEFRPFSAARVVEDGPVRMVIEACFKYRDSRIVQKYLLPKEGTEIHLQLLVCWNERRRMLKLSVPTTFSDGKYMGQTLYGAAELPDNGDEAVSQKWQGVFAEGGNRALVCINDGIYGSDFHDGEVRLSLLRSPAYASMKIRGGTEVRHDRHLPVMDQGEHVFNFRIDAGEAGRIRRDLDRTALLHNESPYALAMFCSGPGANAYPLIVTDGDAVCMTALKKSETNDDYYIRLFEPTGTERDIIVRIPLLGIAEKIIMSGYEIRTLCIKVSEKRLVEADLMEEVC